MGRLRFSSASSSWRCRQTVTTRFSFHTCGVRRLRVRKPNSSRANRSDFSALRTWAGEGGSEFGSIEMSIGKRLQRSVSRRIGSLHQSGYSLCWTLVLIRVHSRRRPHGCGGFCGGIRHRGLSMHRASLPDPRRRNVRDAPRRRGRHRVRYQWPRDVERRGGSRHRCGRCIGRCIRAAVREDRLHTARTCSGDSECGPVSHRSTTVIRSGVPRLSESGSHGH